ncbi:MAG: glycosyltransferase family 2 protein [Lachnospiraceae bacterium]|nr:glycosyltransferase family 2 protein [Lachnospiraceae bacterium]
MKVTVVIPNYNGLHFLDKCLSSMGAQTFDEVRTLVVDNGSTDGSTSYIRENFPWVELIELGENTGFDHAVNVGIEKAQTPYVLLLNNDTEAEPEFVEELCKAIDVSENIFSVSSKMLNYTKRDIMDDAGDFYSVIGWQFQRGVGRCESVYNKPSKVFSACAGAAIYRKSILERIGCFDESFFAYLEDIDIGYRAKIQGYENVFCPTARVYHVGSGSSGSKYNDFKVSLSSRNSIYLIYKNMPITLIIINFPALFFGYLVKWLFFVKKGFGGVYLKGITEGIKTCRKNCKKVPFEFKNFGNYVKIEFELIYGVFLYVYEFIMRRLGK